MNEEINAKRHSLAHLLAAAVLDLYPDTKNAIGPAIETGFYYDFEFQKPITDTDLEKIEAKMLELLPKWDNFDHEEVDVSEAKKRFANNPYKLELIDEIVEKGETITLYTSGTFTDLCRGGHVDSMSDIDPQSFTLDRLAGAYWRGNEANTQLTRIYGLAFDTKDELEAFTKQREEAKERDHRKLGKELGLFAFSDRVGKGLPMFLPKGNIIKTELENFIRKEKEDLGYQFVTIPHIAKCDLYETSGHLGKYDAMMPIMEDESGDKFVLKAMNCPHHFEIFNAEPRSYKDLPLRIAENTVVYRNEKSGELNGLFRVKNLTQDDTHHFITPEQIEDEIKLVLGLMDRVYSLFGFTDYKVEISVRDPQNKDAYFGDDDVWTKSENILVETVKDWGVEYSIEEGEAAFYGPKIDIRVKDSLGRDWQLTTVQLDFNQAENFDMNYVGEDGKKHKVAVLHVAIFGSLERFMGVLIEHYGGKFPLWLSPTQISILPIADAHKEYAEKVHESLKEAGIRADIDESNESLGKKIYATKKQKTPYFVVLGDAEVEKGSVTLEHRDEGKIGELSIEELVEKLSTEIKEKK
jgi:threonyl-tRNA synthetase